MLPISQCLLRRDFGSFIARVFSTLSPNEKFLPNWHIALIAEYLEAVRQQQIQRLIINMPPRYLKSICVSVAWPAWLLGQDPTSRIIAASYGARLSIKHSLDCRAVLRTPWYQALFPGVQLAKDQNQKSKFMTSARGFRLATSIGGSLTGEGGNYLIIDDPLNAIHATSHKHRDEANRWFDHSFSSRLDDKRHGAMVLVMQRLHADDLTGHLLEKGGWEHVMLPVRWEQPKTHTFRQIIKECAAHELLHEARENHAMIARAKIELGSSAFAAQYLQSPLAENTGMVKRAWLKHYTPHELPLPRRIVQSWDTAIKTGTQHDASACLTFYEHEGKSFLVESCVMRVEYPDLKRAVLQLAEKWKPSAILMEDKSSGQQLLQDIRRETYLPLIGLLPKGNKETRFAAISALLESGKLFLPHYAPWLADFETELLQFPHGVHDDQVDALTQYFDWVRAGNWQKMAIRNF